MSNRRQSVARGLRTERGRLWSLQQIALVGISTIGAVVYLLALNAAAPRGVDPVAWLLLLGPLLLLRVGDSAWPLAYWALMILLWVQVTPTGSFSWWSLPAAVGLTLAHAATALGASAPPAAEIPPGIRRVWLGRTAGAIVAAAATAGAIQLVTSHLSGLASGLASAAYIVGLLGVAGLLWLTRSNPPEPPD